MRRDRIIQVHTPLPFVLAPSLAESTTKSEKMQSDGEANTGQRNTDIRSRRPERLISIMC